MLTSSEKYEVSELTDIMINLFHAQDPYLTAKDSVERKVLERWMSLRCQDGIVHSLPPGFGA